MGLGMAFVILGRSRVERVHSFDRRVRGKRFGLAVLRPDPISKLPTTILGNRSAPAHLTTFSKRSLALVGKVVTKGGQFFWNELQEIKCRF